MQPDAKHSLKTQEKNIKAKHLLFKKYLDFAGTVFLMLLQINIKGVIEEKFINTISFKGQYLLISCVSQNCSIVIIKSARSNVLEITHRKF